MKPTPNSFDLAILGGGQLARMSIAAAQRIGLRCISLDPGTQTPASELAPALVGSLSDPEAVAQLLTAAPYATLENEFIPADTIRAAFALAGKDESTLLPGVNTLATIQDKLLQRQAYLRHRVPSPRAFPLSPETAPQVIADLGFPMVLKARFGGYDGKGTRYVRTPEELESHRPLWQSGTWMAEEFVPFQAELAVMVYRSPERTGAFPTMTTVQSNHVCDLVFPSPHDATAVAISAVEALDGYGLFGVELFLHESGHISINEIAPRPHNTGHYTLDWGGVSQFEQHIRLACRLPIAPANGQPAAMANLLGLDTPHDWKLGLRAALAAAPTAHVHWYGKAESRPGRKMGHINAVGPDALNIVTTARAAFLAAWATGP